MTYLRFFDFGRTVSIRQKAQPVNNNAVPMPKK